MEIPNLPDGMIHGTKRKKGGSEIWRRRQERAELEKGGLRILLQQKTQKVKELKFELINRKSRVMELEAEKLFLTVDLHNQSMVEKELRQQLAMAENKICEMLKNDKEKAWKGQYRAKQAVLKVFKWEEGTTKPEVLRAICAFWEALSIQPLDSDIVGKKKRRSKWYRMNTWKDIT